MLLLYILFILVPASLAQILHYFNNSYNDRSQCPKSIREYLKHAEYSFKNYRNSILVYNTEVFMDKLCLYSPPKKYLPSTILYNNLSHEENFSKFTKFEHAVIFLENLQSAPKVAAELLERPLVWTSDLKYQFLIINRSNITSSDLKLTMEELWDPHRVLNYVIVYEDAFENMQVVAYNPFEEGKILNYSSTWQPTTSHIFPTKQMYNLYGYKIKILFENTIEPAGNFHENHCKDTVCTHMRYFFPYINAGYEVDHRQGEIKHIYTELKNKLEHKKIDLGLLSMWLTKQMGPYATYSISQWEIAALVPKAKPMPMILSLLFIFDFYVWFFLLVLSLIFFWLRKIIIKIEALLGARYIDTGLKMLLFCISMYTIIFQSAFQGAVITSLTSPRYYKDIDNIDDLMKSGLEVYGEKEWQELVNNKITSITQMSFVDVATELHAISGSQAYLVTEKWKQIFLTNKTSSGDSYSKFYHEVKEPMGAGRITYYMQRNSPFKNVFNKFLLLLHDHGLNLNFGEIPVYLKTEKHFQNLSLSHLYGAFIPLACGLVISSLVFLGELLLFHLKIKF